MSTQDIVVIHSTENCHLWSGSCPHCVKWTLLNRKYGGCEETPTVSIEHDYHIPYYLLNVKTKEVNSSMYFSHYLL